jgi:hypothetical protein
MSKDLRPSLDAWPYDENERVTARKVIGADGKPKIQMRLEMGILQMELTGRPDGERPYGFDSLLDLFEDALERHRFSDEEFSLDRSDCAALHHESMLHEHRRICCLQIGEFQQAESDAEHNLRIMDLLEEYAEDRRDWVSSEQHRAYVISHLTQARAMRVLRERGPIPALRHVEEGEGALRKLLAKYGRPELATRTPEFHFLQELRKQIESGAPLSERDRLEIQLRSAVSTERYEEAARLRDIIEELP